MRKAPKNPPCGCRRKGASSAQWVVAVYHSRFVANNRNWHRKQTKTESEPINSDRLSKVCKKLGVLNRKRTLSMPLPTEVSNHHQVETSTKHHPTSENEVDFRDLKGSDGIHIGGGSCCGCPCCRRELNTSAATGACCWLNLVKNHPTITSSPLFYTCITTAHFSQHDFSQRESIGESVTSASEVLRQDNANNRYYTWSVKSAKVADIWCRILNTSPRTEHLVPVAVFVRCSWPRDSFKNEPCDPQEVSKVTPFRLLRPAGKFQDDIWALHEHQDDTLVLQRSASV